MVCKLNPLTFKKLVEDVVRDIGGNRYCVQSPAFLPLQQAAEHYIQVVFWEQLKDIVQLAGRQKVLPEDIQEWKRSTGFRPYTRRSSQSLNTLLNSLPPKSKVHF